MISVIVPVYNAQNSIIACLNSVKNQSVGSQLFEIILVNDGSTDLSLSVMETYKQNHPELNIILLSQENKGVSAARNLALKHATGDFIALLDADDVWMPEKTEKQLPYLQNPNLKIDFLACRRNNLKILPPYVVKNDLAKVSFNKLLIRNETQPSTVIFKKDLLKKVGFFNENYRYTEDFNYWLRVSKEHTMCILDQNLVIAGNGKRTFGVSGLSANLSEMQKGFQQNLKELLHQKRINQPQFFFYSIFYKAKYVLLLLRKTFYKASIE